MAPIGGQRRALRLSSGASSIGFSESVPIDGRDLLAAEGVPSPIDDVHFCNPLGRIVGDIDKCHVPAEKRAFWLLAGTRLAPSSRSNPIAFQAISF
jgi:hypothetical protein